MLFAHAASLILLAFAVSLDGFGVGVTYGLRRIRIPVLSVVIIALCSGIVVWVSMQIGTLLTRLYVTRVRKGNRRRHTYADRQLGNDSVLEKTVSF